MLKDAWIIFTGLKDAFPRRRNGEEKGSIFSPISSSPSSSLESSPSVRIPVQLSQSLAKKQTRRAFAVTWRVPWLQASTPKMVVAKASKNVSTLHFRWIPRPFSANKYAILIPFQVLSHFPIWFKGNFIEPNQVPRGLPDSPLPIDPAIMDEDWHSGEVNNRVYQLLVCQIQSDPGPRDIGEEPPRAGLQLSNHACQPTKVCCRLKPDEWVPPWADYGLPILPIGGWLDNTRVDWRFLLVPRTLPQSEDLSHRCLITPAKDSFWVEKRNTSLVEFQSWRIEFFS